SDSFACRDKSRSWQWQADCQSYRGAERNLCFPLQDLQYRERKVRLWRSVQILKLDAVLLGTAWKELSMKRISGSMLMALIAVILAVLAIRTAKTTNEKRGQQIGIAGSELALRLGATPQDRLSNKFVIHGTLHFHLNNEAELDRLL